MKYTVIIAGSDRRFIAQDYDTKDEAAERLEQVKSKAQGGALSVAGVEADGTVKDLGAAESVQDPDEKQRPAPKPAPSRSGPRRGEA